MSIYILAVCLTILAPQRALPAQGDIRDAEYELKAAFLVQVLNFVTFPTHASGSKPLPGLVVVLGKDPFGKRLSQKLAAAKSGQRTVQVVPFSDLKGIADLKKPVHVIYFARSDDVDLREAINSASEHGTLTVGDTEDFCKQGGMVSLLKRSNRMHMEINRDAIEKAGLTISSKLLAIATIVSTTPQDKEP